MWLTGVANGRGKRAFWIASLALAMTDVASGPGKRVWLSDVANGRGKRAWYWIASLSLAMTGVVMTGVANGRGKWVL